MTEAIENSSTEHQLDLDFRMTIVKAISRLR